MDALASRCNPLLQCVRDMQMSSVAMCKLGPAQSTLAQNGPCTPGDETPVLDMVKESAASAIENGAGAVSATVEFATPLFLVPTRLVNEVSVSRRPPIPPPITHPRS